MARISPRAVRPKKSQGTYPAPNESLAPGDGIEKEQEHEGVGAIVSSPLRPLTLHSGPIFPQRRAPSKIDPLAPLSFSDGEQAFQVSIILLISSPRIHPQLTSPRGHFLRRFRDSPPRSQAGLPLLFLRRPPRLGSCALWSSLCQC